MLYYVVEYLMFIFYCNKYGSYYICKNILIFVGKVFFVLYEKIILLVGVIGLGKSILVDGFVNYIMGVSFDDLFWFIIIKLENEEKKIYN